jgi:hypothetical protein
VNVSAWVALINKALDLILLAYRGIKSLILKARRKKKNEEFKEAADAAQKTKDTSGLEDAFNRPRD